MRIQAPLDVKINACILVNSFPLPGGDAVFGVPGE
jgi:hypothetical protein